MLVGASERQAECFKNQASAFKDGQLAASAVAQHQPLMGLAALSHELKAQTSQQYSIFPHPRKSGLQLPFAATARQSSKPAVSAREPPVIPIGQCQDGRIVAGGVRGGMATVSYPGGPSRRNTAEVGALFCTL